MNLEKYLKLAIEEDCRMKGGGLFWGTIENQKITKDIVTWFMTHCCGGRLLDFFQGSKTDILFFFQENSIETLVKFIKEAVFLYKDAWTWTLTGLLRLIEESLAKKDFVGLTRLLIGIYDFGIGGIPHEDIITPTLYGDIISMKCGWCGKKYTSQSSLSTNNIKEGSGKWLLESLRYYDDAFIKIAVWQKKHHCEELEKFEEYIKKATFESVRREFPDKIILNKCEIGDYFELAKLLCIEHPGITVADDYFKSASQYISGFQIENPKGKFSFKYSPWSCGETFFIECRCKECISWDSELDEFWDKEGNVLHI